MPKILVEVNLDPAPGWGNKVEDFVESIAASRGVPDYYLKHVTPMLDTMVAVIRVKDGFTILHGIYSNMETAKTEVDNFRKQFKEYNQYHFVYCEVPTDQRSDFLIQKPN